MELWLSPLPSGTYLSHCCAASGFVSSSEGCVSTQISRERVAFIAAALYRAHPLRE